MPKAKVSEYKKKIVKDMIELAKQYSIVGLVNMEDLPAPQLQSMRSELRGKIELFMTKKRLMKIALDEMKNEKKGIEELEKYFVGMPALIFTNEDPFKLSKLLQKSKTSAPAKAGQIAPSDIVVNKGPTPFAPGPVISELSAVGLKVGVEGGKVAVKEDTVVAKKGEKIKPKVAEILARLDIKPMEVGLGLVAAYEKGIIYQKDILEVDEEEYSNNINLAATQALNLSFNITYVTKDNASLLISKAFNDAKALGISQKILDKGIIEDLLGEAEREMLSLKNSANIEVTEAPKETKEEEKLTEEKPSVKEEKPQEIKEESKPKIKEEVEVKKEEPKPEPVKEVEEQKEPQRQEPEVKEEIKEEPKIEELEEKPEEKPKEDETDKKVSTMVEQTKKFIEGKEETAEDIIEEVKKEEQEEKQEEKTEEPKPEKEDKEKVPTTHDLKTQKEEKEKKDEREDEDKERKEVEELTKELLKKGTLRK